MTAPTGGEWDVTPAEAVALQERLRDRVVREDRLRAVGRVAGVDVAYEADGGVAWAAVVVLRPPGLEVVDRATARAAVRFPYVPGLLAFREGPAVVDAFRRLRVVPDLVLYDGQGIAHPRRFGVACHLAVVLDVPCVGVAKTRFVGEHGAVPAGKGEWTPLTDRGEVVGAVLRSRAGVKPVYVSVGHRVALETAVRWVMACVGRYRVPEPIREAHRAASEACRRGVAGGGCAG